MDENADAAGVHRSAFTFRSVVRAGVFTLAVLAGAFLGVTVARSVTPHAPLAKPSHAQSAQLLPPDGAGPPSFADVVAVVKPSVIGVQAKVLDTSDESLHAPLERFGKRFGAPRTPALPPHPRPGRSLTAQGSGFFISPDGYAVTNNHVVEGSTSVQVQTDDQKMYTAKVIGTDPTTDLALIKVEGRNDFAHVTLADAPPRVGDWVVAVGNPFGLGGTVTAGIVSARERDIGADSSDRLIQIDAPINKGDSGGPSFGLDGRVIGVNTMIFSPSGGSIGIAFAIPADIVKSVIPQLRDKGSVVRGWLGVQAQPVTPEIADSLGLKDASGALVAEPQPDSPAAKAGIAPGDVIASVDGRPIKDARDLSKTIAATAPGTEVKLGVRRQKEESTVTVALGTLPAKREASAPARAHVPGDDRETTGQGGGSNGRGPLDLGLHLAPAHDIPGSGDQGLIVTGVEPGSAAADEGLELGDVILDVGGKAVSTAGDFEAGVDAARRSGKRTVLLRLRSGDGMRFVAVPTG